MYFIFITKYKCMQYKCKSSKIKELELTLFFKKPCHFTTLQGNKIVALLGKYKLIKNNKYYVVLTAKILRRQNCLVNRCYRRIRHPLQLFIRDSKNAFYTVLSHYRNSINKAKIFIKRKAF